MHASMYTWQRMRLERNRARLGESQEQLLLFGRERHDYHSRNRQPILKGTRVNVRLPRWSALFLAGAAFCLSYAPIYANKQEIVTLSIRLCEDVPNQKKPRTLAQPTVMARVNHPVMLEIGGVAKSKFDQSDHEIGTKLVAHIRREGDSTYVLHLKSSISHQKQLQNDPQTEVFVANQLTLRTVMKAGEWKKIPVSATRWYDLLLEKSAEVP